MAVKMKNKAGTSKHSLASKRQSSTLQSTSNFTFLRLSARPGSRTSESGHVSVRCCLLSPSH